MIGVHCFDIDAREGATRRLVRELSTPLSIRLRNLRGTRSVRWALAAAEMWGCSIAVGRFQKDIKNDADRRIAPDTFGHAFGDGCWSHIIVPAIGHPAGDVAFFGSASADFAACAASRKLFGFSIALRNLEAGVL